MIVNEGGKKLPKLTTPGTSADLLTGKELIDQYGNVVEGGMPIVEKEAPTFLTTYLATRGQITATAGYQVGYYERGGEFSATHTLSSEDDPNFVPENIVSDRSIFGVQGTLRRSAVFTEDKPNGMTYGLESSKLKIELPGTFYWIGLSIWYKNASGASNYGVGFHLGNGTTGQFYCDTYGAAKIFTINRIYNPATSIIEFESEIPEMDEVSSVSVIALSY